MSDDEYQPYQEWLAGLPKDGPVTAVVVCLPEKEPVE